MALILCPNCGKEVSDKATNCPHCETLLKEPEKKHCIECGTELDEGLTACPKCGCPIEKKEKDESIIVEKKHSFLNDRNKTKKLMIGIVAVIALIVIVMFANNAKKENDIRKAEEAAAVASAEYFTNLYSATSAMISGAARAEEAGALIHDVWYNAIYEELDSATDAYTRPNGRFVNDFNEALANLFSDNSFQSDMSYIASNQSEVKEYMKSLKNPTDEYKEAYEAINELYDAYLEFTNHVIDPQGNLQTFTSNFNDYDSNVVNCYKHMQIYLEE